MSTMIGKKVLVRTYSAGVHFGTLVSQCGPEVTLADTRRIWYWEKAFTLSKIAVDGLGKNSKLSISIPEILLTAAIEVIPVSEKSEKILTEIEAHDPK